jgi:2,3-dihydroxyphenylpropionate 1,2-dioxygenase
MERCYAFGQAVARTVTALGLKTWCCRAAACRIFPAPTAIPIRSSLGQPPLDQLRSGKLKSLIGYDERARRYRQYRAALLACAAGALGERKPDIVSMDRAGTTTTPRSPGPRRTARRSTPRTIRDQARAG